MPVTARELAELWQKIFDHVYVVSWGDAAKKRLPSLECELRRVGLLGAVDLSYCGPLPRTDEQRTATIEYFRKHVRKGPDGRPFLVRADCPGAFGVADAMVNVFYEALNKGFKRVLFLESDVRFLANLELLARVLRDYPEQSDIVRFGLHAAPGRFAEINTYADSHRIRGRFFETWNRNAEDFGIRVSGGLTAMGVSERGMCALIESLTQWPTGADQFYWPGSFGWNRTKPRSVAVALPNVVEQEVSFDSLTSVIHDQRHREQINYMFSRPGEFVHDATVEQKNKTGLVVAFTTHGERAHVIDPIVENHIRLARNIGAETRLYIQPETEKLLAPETLSRQKPGEFSIKLVERDYGPVTKYLGPALDDEIAERPVIIVDDDNLYSEDCFSQLYKFHLGRPGHVIAHSARAVPFAKDEPGAGARQLDPQVSEFKAIPRLPTGPEQIYFVEHGRAVLYPGDVRVAPPLFRAMAQSFFGRQDDLLVSALMVSRHVPLYNTGNRDSIRQLGIPGSRDITDATSLFRLSNMGQDWLPLLRELAPFFDQKASFWS